MLCKKCGKEIPDNSKFCGYCGQVIETVDSLNSTNNQEFNNLSIDDNANKLNSNIIGEPEQTANTGVVENSVTPNSDAQIQSASDIQNSGLENHSSDLNNSNIQTEFEPLQSVENPKPVVSSNKKKKSNKVLLIVIAALLVIAINILAFMSMNKNKSTKSSISVLEKAVGNFGKKGNESGTVTAKVQVESSTSDVINLSASILYEKENDDYRLNLKLNKSALNDEMNLYSIINKNKGTVYVNSKTVDMLGMTESNLDTWLTYSQALDGIRSEINSNETKNKNIKLEKIVDKEHFKLVGKENGLNHYVFTIDEKFFENAKNNLELNDEDKDSIDGAIEILKSGEIKRIELDIYIDSSNEIAKISIDLAKFINIEDIKKAELSIEFKDFNSTKVEIPKEAMSATMNIEDYVTLYSIDDEDYDLNLDLDNDLDLNNTDLNF